MVTETAFLYTNDSFLVVARQPPCIARTASWLYKEAVEVLLKCRVRLMIHIY